MEFEQIVNERYATKVFDEKPIPEDDVNKLLDLIRLAPSSFNIQPWKILVIKDATLKQQLLPVSYNQSQVATCSHLLVFCADSDILGKINALKTLMIQAGAQEEQIQGYIDMMLGFEKGLTPEQKISWAQRQTYIALGNAVNGAKALGFDSGPMEGFTPQGYVDILKLPSNIHPTALCAIGYGKDTPKPKVRFPKEEVFKKYY